MNVMRELDKICEPLFELVNDFDIVISCNSNDVEIYDLFEVGQMMTYKKETNLYKICTSIENDSISNYRIYAYVWVIENDLPIFKPIALLNYDGKTWKMINA